MSLADERLDDYLGSKHSAVGLLLCWFGVPMLIGGSIFALTVSPSEFPLWGSVSLAAWGLIAVPLGLSMRRKRPSPVRWAIANVLLGAAMLASFALLLTER